MLGGNGEFRVEDYLRVLIKRAWLIGGVFVVVVTTVAIWTFQQPKIYRATARVEISNERPNVVLYEDVVPSGPESYWGMMRYLQTQYLLMSSPAVCTRAVENMKAEPGGLPAELSDSSNPAGRLRSALSVTPVQDSMLVDLSASHTDPELAARYANAAAQAYKQENLYRRLRATQEAVDWLAKQLETYKERKHEAEKAVLGFKKEHNIVSLEERHNLVLKSLTSRTSAYEEASSERITLESEHKKLKQLAAGGLSNKKALIDLFSGTEVEQLDDQLDEIDQEITTLSSRYKPAHPKMQALEAERSALKERIDREVQRTLDARGAQIALLKAKEDTLKSEMEKAKVEALDLEQKITEFRDLMAEAETSQKFYDALDTRLNEADLTSLIQYNNIRVVNDALVPGAPIAPRSGMHMLVGLAIGLFGGVGAAFGLEFLDRTVKSVDDIERVLGLPVLGGVPTIEAGADLFVIENPQSHVAECWRSVRTNLLFSQPDNPPNVLLVTSAAPQEGKTTTVVNLGITLAQSGARTLIVDTDLRRPRLHQVFGVAGGQGVTQMVVGDGGESVVMETGIENLWVLPAGAIPPNPAELLGSAAFRDTLAAWAKDFDRVILDSPPVMAVTDAAVLGPCVDGVVLVARAGSTHRDGLAQAHKRLTDVKANVLGVVVNALSPTSAGYTPYSYRYSYSSAKPEEQ